MFHQPTLFVIVSQSFMTLIVWRSTTDQIFYAVAKRKMKIWLSCVDFYEVKYEVKLFMNNRTGQLQWRKEVRVHHLKSFFGKENLKEKGIGIAM